MPPQGQHGGAEEILLDLNKLAEGHKFLGLGAYAVSDDGNLLAYSTDTTGYRQYTLHVKDLRTGQMLTEKIERVGSVVWATDNKTLFYTTEDAVSKRSDKFWRHVVGATASDLLYEEKNELFDVGAGRSLDKKMIFLGGYAKTSSELRYLPADDPTGDFQGRSCRARPDTSTTSITTTATSTSRPTRARRTSRSSRRRSTIRPRRTGSRSSSTTRRSRSTASVSSPTTSSSRSAKAG